MPMPALVSSMPMPNYAIIEIWSPATNTNRILAPCYKSIADSKDFGSLHGKPGEAYTRLITASCEAGPGTTHMCTFEICAWSLQILEIADRCVFHNSIFGLSKCHLYIDFMKNLKSSC